MTDEEENKLLRKALIEIYLSRSLDDSKSIAYAAIDDTCPFLALVIDDAVNGVEKARKAS